MTGWRTVNVLSHAAQVELAKRKKEHKKESGKPLEKGLKNKAACEILSVICKMLLRLLTGGWGAW